MNVFLLASLGRLWLAGVSVSWNNLHTGELCSRLSLPTYPFERQRYWIHPPRHPASVQHSSVSSGNQDEHRNPEEPAVTFYPCPGLTTSYVAPHSPLEQTLATIWQQLLGVDLIGRYDSFFELGGHSLLATQLASRLRSELQVHLPLRAIFEATTIAELGQVIESSDFASLNEEDFSLPLLPLAQRASCHFLRHRSASGLCNRWRKMRVS